MNYPWYEILDKDDDSISQGDFIHNCPILEPPRELPSSPDEDILDINFKVLNVVILSQSCDLVHEGKIDIVLVSPISAYNEYFKINVPQKQQTPRNYRKTLERLKRGEHVGYHLLDRDRENNEDIATDDLMVVDFKNVYGIQFRALSALVKQKQQRIRLLPPYREHLSQSFARFFMRVGLPQDIDLEDESLA